MFGPGGQVLLPFDEAAKAWEAYRAGDNTWKPYLKGIEPQLTQAAFQNLCGLVSPEPEPEVDPNKVIPLRLLESTPVENPSSDRLAALEDELNNLSLEELTRRVKPNDDGDDAA